MFLPEAIFFFFFHFLSRKIFLVRLNWKTFAFATMFPSLARPLSLRVILSQSQLRRTQCINW